MTEEMRYYTGNCITDLHIDTYNKEKCKQYIKSDGLIFCMRSVCPEKDCIYALVNKLYQTIDRLEQENKELKTWLESKEKQLKHLIEYNQNKKDQIKTLKFMLFDEKEIPKDKFTMMYRIAQNERRTRSHRDLCTNITKKYRSTLEEINQILLGVRGLSIHCDEQIIKAKAIINEVLNA